MLFIYGHKYYFICCAFYNCILVCFLFFYNHNEIWIVKNIKTFAVRWCPSNLLSLLLNTSLARWAVTIEEIHRASVLKGKKENNWNNVNFTSKSQSTMCIASNIYFEELDAAVPTTSLAHLHCVFYISWIKSSIINRIKSTLKLKEVLIKDISCDFILNLISSI